jgi:hypothetical protein
MIGNGYWSCGIAVEWKYAGSGEWGWGAWVEYLDDGFVNDNTDAGVVSTEGTLHTRYPVRHGETADALTVAIDVIRADAERLGITWKNPKVWYRGEEPAPGTEGMPWGWRRMLNTQSDRLGWEHYYAKARSLEAKRS